MSEMTLLMQVTVCTEEIANWDWSVRERLHSRTNNRGSNQADLGVGGLGVLQSKMSVLCRTSL